MIGGGGRGDGQHGGLRGKGKRSFGAFADQELKSGFCSEEQGSYPKDSYWNAVMDAGLVDDGSCCRLEKALQQDKCPQEDLMGSHQRSMRKRCWRLAYMVRSEDGGDIFFFHN